MLSESARMASAGEARFRVQAPNSLPRTVKVIALDPDAEAAVRPLAEAGFLHARFFTAAGSPAASDEARLADLSGGAADVAAEVETADLIVFVAGPGGRAFAAAQIGEACSRRRIMTTGLVVGARTAPESELSKTLIQIRPWSLMLVIARNDDYIADMMTALRA